MNQVLQLYQGSVDPAPQLTTTYMMCFAPGNLPASIATTLTTAEAQQIYPRMITGTISIVSSVQVTPIADRTRQSNFTVTYLCPSFQSVADSGRFTYRFVVNRTDQLLVVNATVPLLDTPSLPTVMLPVQAPLRVIVYEASAINGSILQLGQAELTLITDSSLVCAICFPQYSGDDTPLPTRLHSTRPSSLIRQFCRASAMSDSAYYTVVSAQTVQQPVAHSPIRRHGLNVPSKQSK